MIATLILIFSALTFALPMPGPWSSAFKIIERHEFYPEKKTIIEPRDSWQHLFSVLILNENFEEQKDCVFFYVPGEVQGKLKINTVDIKTSCADVMLNPGSLSWDEVSDLRYDQMESGLKLSFTLKKKDFVSWEIQTQGFSPPQPELHLSSAEMKSPPFVLLAKAMRKEKEESPRPGKDQVCHGINDECEEVSASICHLCEEGWYEIPNGCSKGPKYCGRLACGGRNQPACRRGRDYQKKEKNFDCRMDHSFAYCQRGLSIQCEGQKAYCR